MLKVALLSVIRFPSFVKSILQFNECVCMREFFSPLIHPHTNSPSKLNRFFIFVSYRLHFVSYYCIDRCADALSSNNTPFQMIRFSTFFSFISMIYFFKFSPVGTQFHVLCLSCYLHKPRKYGIYYFIVDLILRSVFDPVFFSLFIWCDSFSHFH